MKKLLRNFDVLIMAGVLIMLGSSQAFALEDCEFKANTHSLFGSLDNIAVYAGRDKIDSIKFRTFNTGSGDDVAKKLALIHGNDCNIDIESLSTVLNDYCGKTFSEEGEYNRCLDYMSKVIVIPLNNVINPKHIIPYTQSNPPPPKDPYYGVGPAERAYLDSVVKQVARDDAAAAAKAKEEAEGSDGNKNGK